MKAIHTVHQSRAGKFNNYNFNILFYTLQNNHGWNMVFNPAAHHTAVSRSDSQTGRSSVEQESN